MNVFPIDLDHTDEDEPDLWCETRCNGEVNDTSIDDDDTVRETNDK